VNVLSKGRRIIHPKGQEIELHSLLGGGKYSEVWKATLSLPNGSAKEVAVKFMAADLDKKERQFYFREVETLISLMNYGVENSLWEKSVPLVPLFYFADKGHEPPYFVQSLAVGKPIDEIIREGMPMIEADVVFLGAQLYKVFQALHEGLNRSYLDFQPRNVFLLTEKSNRRLTVIDWNLLSDEIDCDVDGDLRTVARLLYRLVIGCPPSPQELELPENWSSLSISLRTFFVRALSPSFSRLYYPDAHSMQCDLSEQDGRWKKSGKQLIQDAAKSIGELEDSTGNLEVRLVNVLDIVDIAKRKNLDATSQELLEKLESDVQDKLGDPGYIRKVIQYYRVGDLDKAREALQDASAEAITSQTRLLVARWSAALEFKDGDKDEIVKLANSLDEYTGHWLETRVVNFDLFVGESLSVDKNHPLAIETSFWQSFYESNKSENDSPEVIRERIDSYHKVIYYGEKLPYSQILLNIIGGKDLLHSEVEYLAQQSKKLVEEAALRERLENAINTNLIRATDILRKELENHSQRQITSDYVIDCADKLVNQKEFSIAKRLINSTWQDLSPTVQEKAITLKKEAQEQLDRERDILDTSQETTSVMSLDQLLKMLERYPQLEEVFTEYFKGTQIPDQAINPDENVEQLSPIELIKEKMEKGEIGESELLQSLGIRLHQHSDSALTAPTLQDDDIDPAQTHLKEYMVLLNDSNFSEQDTKDGEDQSGNDVGHSAETLISGPTIEAAPIQSSTGESRPDPEQEKEDLIEKNLSEKDMAQTQKQQLKIEYNEFSQKKSIEQGLNVQEAKPYDLPEINSDKTLLSGTKPEISDSNEELDFRKEKHRTEGYDDLIESAKQKAGLKTLKGLEEAIVLLNQAHELVHTENSDTFLEKIALENKDEYLKVLSSARAAYTRATNAAKQQSYAQVSNEYTLLKEELDLLGNESQGDWDNYFSNCSFRHYYELFRSAYKNYIKSKSLPTQSKHQFGHMKARLEEMKQLEPNLDMDNLHKLRECKKKIQEIQKINPGSIG